jgi:hypothetical protein
MLPPAHTPDNLIRRALTQLWWELPPSQRQAVIQSLSRMVAQNLAARLPNEEVAHEQG